MRLLLVDDDLDLCFMLGDYFHDAGVSVECEPDGLRSVVRTQSEAYDLLILDVMLSGPDGFEILRQIRQQSHLPVIMLTARTGKSDRVRCFELGADDYLSKPFYPEELLARAHAIVRRSAAGLASQSNKALQSGELSLMPGTRTALYLVIAAFQMPFGQEPGLLMEAATVRQRVRCSDHPRHTAWTLSLCHAWRTASRELFFL